MKKQQLVRLFAVSAAAVPGLLLSASIASAQAISSDGFPASVPKAICSPGDHTESGLQGETTQQERFSGDSERAYNCNLELVGEYRGEGAYSQDGPAYFEECAYYGTDHNTSLQQHHGVTVIDASDPQNPQATAFLDDTAAALVPHETVITNERRHLLGVAQNNGPDVAVYDISDCRHPVLKSDIQLPGSQAHIARFAPDGMTYWVTQSFRGPGGFLYSVDVSDPSNPVMLPPWQFLGDGRPHGMNLNPAGFAPGVAEGARVYAGQPGEFGNTGGEVGPDGLVIEDVSDFQFRRPNPQIRIVGKLFWADQGEAEFMIPVKIKGHPYIISTDEAGGAGSADGWAGACTRGQSAFGYPQFIDVADETNPKIIAKLRLEVSDPANCSQLLAETPPDPPGTAPGTNLPAISGTTNYSEERCVADNPNNATMMACSFQNAGLRVFDIRDPQHAKEIAYWKPPAVRTEVRPSSGSWAQGVDRTVDKIAGWARWVVVGKGKGQDKAKQNGNGNSQGNNGNGQGNGSGNGHGNGNGNANGPELQLWTVSDGNGFQVLRFTKNFRGQHKDLFDEALGND